MRAIILAGGRGKRLKQITDYVPKPLVPLNNIPIIEWQIRYLKKFGIKDFIICTGYKGEQIENYLSEKSKLGVKILYSKEKTPLGTGGAIKKASRFIKEKSVIVMNGDVITNINVCLLKSKSNVISAIQLKTKFGVMKTSQDKVITFSEKKKFSNLWMNAGIYHISKELLRDLPKKGDIEKTTFPKYAKNGNLHHIKFRNVFWYSIDSYKDIEDCSKEIGLKKYSRFF